MILFLFLLLLSVLDGKNHNHQPSVHITRKRVIKELYDIGIQQLLPCFPFNKTSEEIGVRLQPTDNLLEWHFSFTGIESSQYDGGVYHGRIVLPKDYPRKAPMIALLTPNGRWEVGKPICLSATAYHQETWDPSWNLRTLVMALRGHMVTYPREIGGILSTAQRRSLLADASRQYICPQCGMKHSDMLNLLDEEEMKKLRMEGTESKVEFLLSRALNKKRHSVVHTSKRGRLNKRKTSKGKEKNPHLINGDRRSSNKNDRVGTVDGNGVISMEESRSLGIKMIVKLLSPIIVMSIAFFVSFTYHSFMNINGGNRNTRMNLDGVGVS